MNAFKHFVLGFLLIYFYSISAQIADTTYAELDEQYMTANILYDRAQPYMDIDSLDGSGIYDTINSGDWSQMYRDMSYSTNDDTILPSIDSLHTYLKTLNTNHPGTRFISVMNFAYNKIKDYAEDSALIFFDNVPIGPGLCGV